MIDDLNDKLIDIERDKMGVLLDLERKRMGRESDLKLERAYNRIKELEMAL